MFKRVPTTTELGHGKFFRSRLLTLSNEGISDYIDGLDKEANRIRADSLRLAWYMRGGITYDQVMQLSYAERNMISDLAKENIETTKKTQLPWF
jgi:hypothetical protein